MSYAEWNATVDYFAGDIVVYLGVPYYCMGQNSNKNPTSAIDGAFWSSTIPPSSLPLVPTPPGVGSQFSYVNGVLTFIFTKSLNDNVTPFYYGVVYSTSPDGPFGNYNPITTDFGITVSISLTLSPGRYYFKSVASSNTIPQSSPLSTTFSEVFVFQTGGGGPAPPPPGPIMTGNTYLVSFLVMPALYPTAYIPYLGTNDAFALSSMWFDAVYTIQTNPQVLNPQNGLPYLQPWTDVWAYWKNLQSNGTRIMLSIGGYTGWDQTLLTDTVGDKYNATDLANGLLTWLDGTASAWNPLPSGFLFDGIDFDFEVPYTTTASPDQQTGLLTLLSVLRAGTSKLITCAPQIPYLYKSSVTNSGSFVGYNVTNAPFTDTNPDPATALGLYAPVNSVCYFSPDVIGQFDYINMQWYNQPDSIPATSSKYYPTPTSLPALGGSCWASSLAQLAYLCLSATSIKKPKVIPLLMSDTNFGAWPLPNVRGVPWEFGGGGMALSLWTGISTAHSALQVALSNPNLKITDWLGGFGSWQMPIGRDYLTMTYANFTLAQQALIPANFFIYAGQSYAPADGVIKPDGSNPQIWWPDNGYPTGGNRGHNPGLTSDLGPPNE